MGCSNDDEKRGNDNTLLAREWNLIIASNGLDGASNYEVGEIKWQFTTQNIVVVTIAPSVELNSAIPFQQNGTYVYVVENETITLENSSVIYTYWIEFDDTLKKTFCILTEELQWMVPDLCLWKIKLKKRSKLNTSGMNCFGSFAFSAFIIQV